MYIVQDFFCFAKFEIICILSRSPREHFSKKHFGFWINFLFVFWLDSKKIAKQEWDIVFGLAYHF